MVASKVCAPPVRFRRPANMPFRISRRLQVICGTIFSKRGMSSIKEMRSQRSLGAWYPPPTPDVVLLPCRRLFFPDKTFLRMMKGNRQNRMHACLEAIVM